MNHLLLQMHYKWKKIRQTTLFSQAMKATEDDQFSQPLYQVTWFVQLSCRDRGIWTDRTTFYVQNPGSLLYSSFQPAHHLFPFFSPFWTNLSLHLPPAACVWMGQFSSGGLRCLRISAARKSTLPEWLRSFQMTAAALSCLVLFLRELTGEGILASWKHSGGTTLKKFSLVPQCLQTKQASSCGFWGLQVRICSHFHPSFLLQQATWLDLPFAETVPFLIPPIFKAGIWRCLDWYKQMCH